MEEAPTVQDLEAARPGVFLSTLLLLLLVVVVLLLVLLVLMLPLLLPLLLVCCPHTDQIRRSPPPPPSRTASLDESEGKLFKDEESSYFGGHDHQENRGILTAAPR